MISAVACAIHRVQGSPAIGPQNDGKGKAPNFFSNPVVSSCDDPDMPKALLPSAP